MIAITGASGQLGQRVINHLLKKTAASDIIALVRNPDRADHLKALGVQVRLADYDQPETLKSALSGVDKLLLISASEVGKRFQQHQAVINAAKEAEVKLFAYTSILKADTSPMKLASEHKMTEAAIKASGLPAVILRNGWYTENYTQGINGVLDAGVLAGAAEHGKIHSASRDDYAEAAAAVLVSAESQAGKVYELAGDEGFTLQQYADEIAKQSGKDIRFQPMSGAEFEQLLLKFGVPAVFADVLADTEIQVMKGWLAEGSGTLSRLIGHPTTPLATSIKQAL